MSEVDGQAAFRAAVLAAGGQVAGEPAKVLAPIPPPRQPTAELLAEWEGRRLEQERRWLTEKRAVDAFAEALDGVADPVARAVLDLHSEAAGVCDEEQDDDGFGPAWPCQTVVTVATTLGLSVPAHLL